jgi:hypothetical protein
METAAWGRKVKMVSLVFIYEHWFIMCKFSLLYNYINSFSSNMVREKIVPTCQIRSDDYPTAS